MPSNDYMHTRYQYEGTYMETFGPRSTDGKAVEPLPTYPDEFLDYWADIYVANRLDLHGILLETFLMFPDEILAMFLTSELPRFDERLLPKQREVQRRLDHAPPPDGIALIEQEFNQRLAIKNPDVVYRNGRFVEPLHHRAWPKGPHRWWLAYLLIALCSLPVFSQGINLDAHWQSQWMAAVGTTMITNELDHPATTSGSLVGHLEYRLYTPLKIYGVHTCIVATHTSNLLKFDGGLNFVGICAAGGPR